MQSIGRDRSFTFNRCTNKRQQLQLNLCLITYIFFSHLRPSHRRSPPWNRTTRRRRTSRWPCAVPCPRTTTTPAPIIPSHGLVPFSRPQSRHWPRRNSRSPRSPSTTTTTTKTPALILAAPAAVTRPCPASPVAAAAAPIPVRPVPRRQCHRPRTPHRRRTHSARRSSHGDCAAALPWTTSSPNNSFNAWTHDRESATTDHQPPPVVLRRMIDVLADPRAARATRDRLARSCYATSSNNFTNYHQFVPLVTPPLSSASSTSSKSSSSSYNSHRSSYSANLSPTFTATTKLGLGFTTVDNPAGKIVRRQRVEDSSGLVEGGAKYGVTAAVDADFPVTRHSNQPASGPGCCSASSSALSTVDRGKNLQAQCTLEFIMAGGWRIGKEISLWHKIRIDSVAHSVYHEGKGSLSS